MLSSALLVMKPDLFTSCAPLLLLAGKCRLSVIVLFDASPSHRTGVPGMRHRLHASHRTGSLV